MVYDGRRVLVTGGAGFIGSHLAAAFARRGDMVTVLDDLRTGNITNVPAGVDFVRADLFDESLPALFAERGFEVVVHCAAQTSVERSVKDPDDDWRINVEGTRHIATLAATAGATFVLFSSGGAIYGEVADRAAEDSPAAPLSPYGRSKLAAESAAREIIDTPIIVRPSNVYGPRQRSDLEGGVVSVFLNRALRGEALELHGGGVAVRDFVYVSDVVDAVLRLVDGDHAGTWNVATGNADRVLDVVKAVGAALGRELDVTTAARRAGDIARSCLDSGALRRATGWAPAFGLHEGIGAMVEDLVVHG